MTTADGALSDRVERAADAIIMALAKAISRQHPVGPADIEDAVADAYLDWAADEVAARLGRPPCDDNCPLLDGMGHTVTVMAKVVIDHVMVEIDLLGQLEQATGRSPAETLQSMLGRVSEAERRG